MKPTASKLISLARLKTLGRSLRSRGRRIVFTNGTFDLLHLGHVDYLEKAKRLGDVLVIGVNSDRSVKSYKTPDRPIVPQKDRLRVLSALACVDYVVLFHEPTPIRLILALKPHILAKGADWKKSQIAGAKAVESWKGKVRRLPLVPGKSTSDILLKIRRGS
jgi:D-beta-D-heptose 7-phosphate kinase/D-beta-D-heptose 1-phosphate adenosyltransferase